MNSSGRSTKPLDKKVLDRFATRAQRSVGLHGEVSIYVTSSREMQALNRRFRGKKKPTDVLSFPSQTSGVAGDIAISMDIAVQSASDLGHAVETELKILVLHGLLHLAGFDHEVDAGTMFRKETALRRQFRLPVGLIERSLQPHSLP